MTAPVSPPAAYRPRSSMRTLVRSAGVVSAIRGLDFGLSFLVSVLLANRFGASGQLDAFFLARRTTVGFADTIRKLIGQVVLPPVMAAVDRGQPLSIHLLPRRVGWFLGLFALALTAAMLVPDRLVILFAPGFRGAQATLTAHMMSIMLPLLPIAVVASFLAAILQARRRYLLSEGTNLVQRAMLVLVLALLIPPLGIVAGAWTMLASGIVGFLILLAGAWSIVRPPRGHVAASAAPRPDANQAAIPAAGGGIVAALVINAYFQATTLLDFAFASTAADGAVASLEYGSRLVSLVPGLVMSSLATVLAPELIHAVQQADRRAAAAGIQRFQRIAVFAQLPVSIGMMLGAPLMVGALFGHGAFDARAIATAAACTAGYAAAQIFLAPSSAITSAIYADPHASPLADLAKVAVAGLVMRVAALSLAAPLWAAGGIAWAAALATAGTFAVAQVVAVRRFHHFAMRPQLIDLARNALCAGIAALAGLALLWVAPEPRALWSQLLLLALLGATVLLAYAAAAVALHVPEVAQVREIVGKIVAKRRRRA